MSNTPAVVDLSKNPKQHKYFIEVCKAINGITNKRYFAYGGAIRGGKTFVSLAILVYLSNKFPGSKWHVVRKDFTTLEATTIPSLEKIIKFSSNWKWKRSKGDYYCEHKNGSRIYFIGENYTRDPELNEFLGLETNGFFLEQIEELNEKIWDMAISRSGSWYINPMPPAFIFTTFNPTQLWAKDKFYLPHIECTLPDSYHYENALPDDNPFVTQDQWNAWKNMASRYQKQFIEGDWNDLSDKDKKWAFAYKYDKHVGKCDWNSNEFTYLSFDFNRNPICCTVIQWYNNTIHIPRVIKLANSNIYNLCQHIKVNYPNAYYIVCGDFTGHNKSALTKDDLNYFDVIKMELGLSSNQMQEISNPRITENQVLVNSILEHYNIIIDKENSQPLIFDLSFVEVLPDGSIKKTDRTDPKQQADALDTFRYWINRYMSNFLKIV